MSESVHLIPASITVKSKIGIENNEVNIHPPYIGVMELAARLPTAAIPMQPTRTTTYANIHSSPKTFSNRTKNSMKIIVLKIQSKIIEPNALPRNN